MVSYGTGPGDVPYHRFGRGSDPLFVFPGVMDSLGWNTPRRSTGELLARYYFRGFREYDTWVASRPVGLAAGDSAETLARRYVPLLEARGGGHVLGLTLGGAIAVHLAARRPDLVDRLVLVACGTSLGSRGHQVVGRWRQFADAENWTALHVDYARTVYSGPRSHVVPVLYRLCSPLLPRPDRGSDVVRSCDALLEYDGAETLGDVEAPALVVTDTDGPLFPEATQRDAARRLENGHVVTLRGGHAVYEESRRAFADAVTGFLDGQHTG